MNTPPPSLFHQGLAAAEAGDFTRAGAIARALLAHNPNDVHGLQILGFSSFRQGDTRKALEAFITADRIAPAQPAILYWIGVLFEARGDYRQAERALRRAVEINPAYGEAWCSLGDVLYLAGRVDDARSAFERALAAEPGAVAILAKCARFHETVHDLEKARALAERARALAPGDMLAAIALTEISLREKKYDEALDILSGFEAGGAAPGNASKISSLKAAALDRLGRYDEAFDALTRAHEIQDSLFGVRAAMETSPLNSATLSQTLARLRDEDFSQWTRHDTLDGPAPIFLLGFIRSGTTWLDQMLSSHPAFEVMEEEDNFIGVWPKFVTDGDNWRKLATLSRAAVNALRGEYWAHARTVSPNSEGLRVVDKVPLNTAQLALIYRIFPEAKIIFALRDPRDSILSALQQHFQINAGMYHFLNPESAARFYDQVMSIGEIVFARTPLSVHTIRYEALVADLESETRRLLGFLGVEWDAAILDYRSTAMARAVRTPSRQQVVQAPYATSIGKWRNYARGLAPALPILQPWVEKFGYDPD